MENRFFFISTYDNYSGSQLSSTLNLHPDFNCLYEDNDPFVANLTNSEMRAKINIDHFIMNEKTSLHKYNGSIQRLATFELQHTILSQKTKTRLRKANITIAPQLRINLLINTWLQTYKDPDIAFKKIKQRLVALQKARHNVFELYNFNYFYRHILQTAERERINLWSAENQLFFLSLAKVLTFDSADLVTTDRIFCFESLITDEYYFIQFMRYLADNQIIINENIKAKLKFNLACICKTIQGYYQYDWKNWRLDFLNHYLCERLETVYHPHIDKALIDHYEKLGYQLLPQKKSNDIVYSKLISIQLNSNRPSQLCTYFDNIEATTNNPHEVEVLINIDDDDQAMEEMLQQEILHRSFTIKYIKTPKPQSFCDLWQPINKLLEITDPNAYFLLNISDEMLFATNGWDSILKKYVSLFPDHIFRLRASRNKFRNYFDRWECSFGQDSIPFTTKRWVDIGGDWNPCFGPDSFQQLVAFYLAKENIFASKNSLRELPIIDIQFHGDVPSLGMDSKKAWKHSSDHIKAMQICQSYKNQLEARRRAILLRANILASSLQLQDYEILDNKSKKQIHLIDKIKNQAVSTLDYKVSWLNITFTNQIRKLHFNAYFGGGKEARRSIIINFAGYLKAKYFIFFLLYQFISKSFYFTSRAIAKTRYLVIITIKRIIKLPFRIVKKLIKLKKQNQVSL